MDGKQPSISSHDLYARLGTASAPVVVDVRRPPDFAKADTLIVSAFHYAPDEVERWRRDLPSGRSVVVHCAHGREVSQNVASALRAAGLDAAYLEGGISGWNDQALPTRRNRVATSNKWVTREHPKIDRIACPWLIHRFIDPRAEFIYVPTEQVLAVATDWRDSLRYRWRRVHARGRALFVRYDPAHLRHQGPGSRPLGDDCQGRRYIAARSDPAMRRPVCNFARPFG